MLSSSRFSRYHRFAIPLFISSALGTLTEVAGAQQVDFMLCAVYDHEIFENVIAYQQPINANNIESDGELFIGRLKANPSPPYTAQSVFLFLPVAVDSGPLPPLSETLNGPEIGFDTAAGFEVVYTKRNGTNWYHARRANGCPAQPPGCWPLTPFPNDPVGSNRWGPFVTQNLDTTASVVYFHTDGDREINRGLAFRSLEDTNLANEELVQYGNPNATFWGHWVRIDNKDYIVSTYGPDTGNDDVDVVLYDPTDPSLTPINLTADRPGRRGDAWIDFDEAALPSGRYTLVDVRTDNSDPTKTFVEVWQRISVPPQPDVWERQYEFTAATAGDAVNPYVQSPELFRFGNHLYIVFVTSDTRDFVTTNRGNIRITRIEADDPDPSDNHYRLLTTEENIVKRTEPEIHYLFNGIPVAFYSEGADPGDGDCPGYAVRINKLMRATTGYLWQGD